MINIRLGVSSNLSQLILENDVIIVTVLAVGKRERSDVYRKAMKMVRRLIVPTSHNQRKIAG